MRVHEIMSVHVLTARREQSVREAGEVMERLGCGMLPVVDEENRLIGVFSEADLLRAIVPEYLQEMEDLSFLRDDVAVVHRALARLDEVTVGEAMRAEPVYTVAEEDSVLEVVREMLQHGFHRVPVVRGKELVGIVTRADVVRELLRPSVGKGSGA